MAIVTDCLQNISDVLSTLDDFSSGRKIFEVYSEEDLLDKSKMLKLPAIGVSYEGLSSVAGENSRQGISAEIRILLVLVLDGKTVNNVNKQKQAVDLLDQMRNLLLTTSSPTNHKWRFISETFAGPMGSVLIYLQRWSTSAPLTGRT